MYTLQQSFKNILEVTSFNHFKLTKSSYNLISSSLLLLPPPITKTSSRHTLVPHESIRVYINIIDIHVKASDHSVIQNQKNIKSEYQDLEMNLTRPICVYRNQLLSLYK